MNEFKVEQFNINGKKGWYMKSTTIRNMLDIKDREYMTTINILKLEDKHAIEVNNENYVSRHGLELIIFRHNVKNEKAFTLRELFNEYKDTMKKPINEGFKPDTSKVSMRVINGRVHLSTNDICHILKVNPTRFNNEFERLYKGNMNGVESLSKDKHGNVLAFLTNKNMFDYVINKFNYDKDGLKQVEKMFEQVD